jgi:tripartite-type tricarboxylate transporter receptor subunit TctC
MKRLVLALALLLPAAVGAGAALSDQADPAGCRLFAGGGNDLIARIVSAKLQEKLGQPVVVDNKPGAQSIVAAELVAKAAPTATRCWSRRAGR